MSKTKIIFVTIGIWVICCVLAAFYYITSISETLEISLWMKLAIFAIYRLPFWLIGLLAIVFLEAAALKPFYQKLNSSFVVGSVCGLIFYYVTTDYLNKSIHIRCYDCVQRFGFPFHYIETSDISAHAGILWFGLMANILTALIFSLVTGLVCKSVWSIFSERPLNLK